MKRKLASVQTIESLELIPKADLIVKAQVMGWSVVVRKDEFKPGDQCVFFEIDSVLPESTEWAEFMRPRGFRVKTCKLRGALSQGLALPMAIVPGAHDVGDDVTEVLGVTKYEPPMPRSQSAAGPFPSSIPKSDEIRVQSALGVLEELRGSPFYISVKCDGTSGTFAKLDDELIVCSRNIALHRGDDHFWKVAEKNRLEEKLPEGFAVQGEVCGPKIQKNRLGLDDHELFIFNVFDIKQERFLDFRDFLAFCHDHELVTVPIERVIEVDDLAEFEISLEHFLELARGEYKGTRNRREGIVVRPTTEINSQALEGSRLSFKVLNNDFLLKDED